MKSSYIVAIVAAVLAIGGVGIGINALNNNDSNTEQESVSVTNQTDKVSSDSTTDDLNNNSDNEVDSSEEEDDDKPSEIEQVEVEDSNADQDDSSTPTDNDSQETDEEIRDQDIQDSEPAPGQYLNSTSAELASITSDTRVVFFKADWCVTCKALEKDIESNLGSIPEGTAIIQVDYDTETDLKSKYGVTRQHTLVQIDVNGEMIDSWGLSRTLDDVIEQIQ